MTVTLLDGIVLARSGFHHSMNYRSVAIFGRARLVDNPAEKIAALEDFMQRIAPGRWNEVREPSAQELKATTVLAIPLEEVSAKLRVGPPKDDEPDYDLPCWAGVVPLRMVADQIGRASCRERECQYGLISGVAGSLNKKNK